MKYSHIALITLAVLSITACAPQPRNDLGRKPPSVDELFDKADTNHDGVLTKQELESALP